MNSTRGEPKFLLQRDAGSPPTIQGRDTPAPFGLHLLPPPLLPEARGSVGHQQPPRLGRFAQLMLFRRRNRIGILNVSSRHRAGSFFDLNDAGSPARTGWSSSADCTRVRLQAGAWKCGVRTSCRFLREPLIRSNSFESADEATICQQARRTDHLADGKAGSVKPEFASIPKSWLVEELPVRLCRSSVCMRALQNQIRQTQSRQHGERHLLCPR